MIKSAHVIGVVQKTLFSLCKGDNTTKKKKKKKKKLKKSLLWNTGYLDEKNDAQNESIICSVVLFC